MGNEDLSKKDAANRAEEEPSDLPQKPVGEKRDEPDPSLTSWPHEAEECGQAWFSDDDQGRPNTVTGR